MKPIFAILMALVLTACGLDGEPVTPDVGVNTTIGVNSRSGTYTDTSVSIHFPMN